jgi:uncharacterized heparinase superfamily protein
MAPARRKPSLLDSETFSFLNEAGRLSQLGWDGIQREKLWRYNQHYFDDLNAADNELRSDWNLRLVLSWINENPAGQGTGWEPYPTSLRIVNWVKWMAAGMSLPEECLQSLAIQTRWLTGRIEWHILGNHLFANAKALVFAGLCFDGAEARNWLNVGLGIIAKELPEQVLPDGGNFERSPMYHSIFLEDLLDLVNIAEMYPGAIEEKNVDQWRAYSSMMLKWLEGACHPDGEIVFFNDAAFGIAPSPAEIRSYATRLKITTDKIAGSSEIVAIKHFVNSGYIRLEAINAVAFLDVAPIGPDYLPGHAHADTLSFELSLFGERIIVNSGTSQYGSGGVRLEERGTAAHSTVEVNGENSSEVWSGFRVARRGYPQGLLIDQTEEGVIVTCAHNGYERLPSRLIHKRSWQLSPGKLVVRDQLVGTFETAIARFHVHPDVQISATNSNTYSLCLPISGQNVQIIIWSGKASIEESFFAPEFGIRLESQCLAVQFESLSEVGVEILWSTNE